MIPANEVIIRKVLWSTVNGYVNKSEIPAVRAGSQQCWETRTEPGVQKKTNYKASWDEFLKQAYYTAGCVGGICHSSQHLGGIGRWIYMTLRSTWSTEWVRDIYQYTERRCLKTNNTKVYSVFMGRMTVLSVRTKTPQPKLQQILKLEWILKC